MGANMHFRAELFNCPGAYGVWAAGARVPGSRM